MKVTDLRQTSLERYTVCFEDGTEIRSTLGAVSEYRVFKGRELDPEKMEAFRKASIRSLTLEKSVEILSHRPMSCKELQDKLVHKGVEKDIAEYCASRLTEMGLIDETQYASSVARHYSGKGYGAGRVRAELSRRGIDREMWEEALSDMYPSDEKIDKLIRSKVTDPSDREQVRKVSASLFRRGYSWEEIRAGFKRYSSDVDIAEPEDD